MSEGAFGVGGHAGRAARKHAAPNFWFCIVEDVEIMDTRYTIGVENICVEVDYLHGESIWPDTQPVIEKYWDHLPTNQLRMICCENGALSLPGS
jgi:hypothetical protein